MRVITGTAKGKRLVTPEGRDVTRPTGEKVNPCHKNTPFAVILIYYILKVFIFKEKLTFFQKKC